jgi:pimeloyl-ACP methyl ester carboxylesterase
MKENFSINKLTKNSRVHIKGRKTVQAEKLICPDGSFLTYQRIPGKNPGVLFLGGFKSDMLGTKASYLADYCQSIGRSFVRFDYFGHGRSSGPFEAGNIGRWKQDALQILDHLTEGPQIVIGSSMGGWIMLLVAKERADRLKGLIGIASAPDFTLDIKNQLDSFEKISDASQMPYFQIKQEYYAIVKHMIEEGHLHHVLQAPIPIQCPVRLLHGMRDKEVSYHKSFKLLESLQSHDVHLTLIKEGDHRLNRPEDLALLKTAILDLS